MSRKHEAAIPCITSKMTPEEMKETEHQIQAEQKRYEISKMIGGIDERGNYTALHHRWELNENA